MKELIEEAEKWDLEPKPVSLWWRSTYIEEEIEDMVIKTVIGEHRLPLEKKFNILGYVFNQAKKMQDSLEEGCRVQTKHGGDTSRFTEAMIYHRESSAEEWWTMSTVFSVLGAYVGLGAQRPWTELKDRRQRL